MSRTPVLREPEPREDLRSRELHPRLSTDDLAALRTVGSFRVIEKTDLQIGNQDYLIRNDYLQRSWVSPPTGGRPWEFLSVTPKGLSQIEKASAPGARQRYWGAAVKPRELAHDLEVYPAFKREEEKIQAAGGTVTRVVVDAEFKQRIYRETNKPGADRAAVKQRLSEELRLPIVDGTLMMPDARIEYTTADGREEFLDLEIATDSACYRGSSGSSKQQAGFTIHNVGNVRRTS